MKRFLHLDFGPNYTFQSKTDGFIQPALPASKSVLNRVLILRKLLGLPLEEIFSEESASRDSKIMFSLLGNLDSLETFNVQDAGTCMRFLTALLALKGRPCKVEGSHNMHNRPIGILIDALRELGAEITYLEKEGYPPFSINAFKPTGKNELKLEASISSQFISALLLIGNALPQGLRIQLKGLVASKGYLLTTIQTLLDYGIKVEWDLSSSEGGWIKVFPSAANKVLKSYPSVEADWSAACYWVAWAALKPFEPHQRILLPNLKIENSSQADAKAAQIIANNFGLSLIETEKGVEISAKPNQAQVKILDPDKPIEVDFLTIPDQAQTFACLFASAGRELILRNIQSLRIKETDRIAALQAELQKFGWNLLPLEESGKDYQLKKFNPEATSSIGNLPKIRTYADHRMAMAFSLIAVHTPIIIEQPDVVEKSYPNYFKELERLGANCETLIEGFTS